MDELLIVELSFAVLVLVCFTMLMGLFKKATSEYSDRKFRQKISLFLTGIIVLFLLLAHFGVFENWNLPPKIFFVPLTWVFILIWVFRNKKFKEVLSSMPKESVIYLQSFRIAVEIVLWRLFILNVVPIQMTFEGYNFDVLIGVTAPLIGFAVASNKISNRAVIIWNILGIVLVSTIVVIAITSTPSPIRLFMNDPANTVIAQVPIVLLPGFLVPLAYFLHFVSIMQYRRLLKKE